VSPIVSVLNRQRAARIDTKLLRQLTTQLLAQLHCQAFEISIFLVGEKRMTELNEHYVQHSGPTDVITFDYRDETRPGWLGGDIFVCVPVAIEQAARFRAPWKEEILRYVIHGILHLSGLEDHSDSGYRRMKREEKRLLKRLVPGSGLAHLGKIR
jgi:probable rRNA maturation factor